MTNLIRQKHVFTYHGDQFFCGDLTLEDYLLISIDPKTGLEKILLEFNEQLPKLNQRQTKMFLNILFGSNDDEKKQDDIMDKLTETERQIEEYKKKHKKEKQQEKIAEDLEKMLQDFHIIEGQMMHALHQPLSEMRKWPYTYFMDLYRDLGVCTGAKEYDKDRNSQKPDKKAFKSEFGDVYNK